MIVISMLVFSMWCPGVPAEKKIIMVYPLPTTDFLGKWMELIFTEAFQRIGLEMKYQQYLAKRATMMANSGEVDGELGRPYNYNTLSPNLVRVEEPSVITYYSAYVTDPTIHLEGWESLKGTSYKVEYRLGSSLAEQKLPDVVEPENLSAIEDWSQGLRKLLAGRTDVFLGPEDAIAPLLAADEYKRIRKAWVMQAIPMYPYLHKRHQELASKLAEVLKQMKAEGRFEYYRKMAEEATEGTP